jgi:hypothetical protein
MPSLSSLHCPLLPVASQQSLRIAFDEQPPFPVKWHTSPSGTQALPQVCPLGQLFGSGAEHVPTFGCIGSITQRMRPAPGTVPIAVESPPQQSLSVWQRSPVTWQPEAGWQIFDVLVPYGAHNELQQPVQPLHTMPSTEQLDATCAHVPATEPLGTSHAPVQQSPSLKQMSPI